MTDEQHHHLTSASDLSESWLSPRLQHDAGMRESARPDGPDVDHPLPEDSLAARLAAPPDTGLQPAPAGNTQPDLDPAERVLRLIETFRSFEAQHAVLFEALCLEQEQLNSVRSQLESDQESWQRERLRQLNELQQEAVQIQEAWTHLENAQRAAAIGSAHEAVIPQPLPAANPARPQREPLGADSSTNSRDLSGPGTANVSNLLAGDTTTPRLTPQPWGSASSAVQFQQLKREFRKHAGRRH